MSATAAAASLPIRMVEKPWGRDTLPHPFDAPAGKRIGEIWFEPPKALPQLLVKYIFTSEKLSVQVHPNDEQALASGAKDSGGGGGKEECWLVINAEPGATLGVGFREPITGDEMRAAALDGSIEELIAWHPVQAGDFFYIPANTVHAIGAGVSLIEVQQNSDITYRLYDYGRPRELHLDAGIAVAKGEVMAPSLKRRVPDEGTVLLADGPYFTLHRVTGGRSTEHIPPASSPAIVIPLQGSFTINGAALHPGEAACIDSQTSLKTDSCEQFLIARSKLL